MPNNYTFYDSNASVITARTSITSGSAHEPLVQISSFLTTVPTTASGNQSVSGTIGASIIGQLPAGTAPLGSVATLQGTNPWIIRGSVSGTVDASLIGMLPAGTQVLGSVATLQGTSPWLISSVYGNISGSVVSYQGTDPWRISSVYGNISGSVLSQQLGTRISSVVNSIPSSLLTGIYGHRNDAIASYLGADLSWRPIATDSAGRTLTKPFSAEESRVEGYASTVNVSVTTLVAAAGAGLRNYITDVWIANTGAATTLVTFRSGGGTSVLGYTIAPTVGGSNLPGLVTPMRTLANETFDFQASTGTSVLYATVKGFRAP